MGSVRSPFCNAYHSAGLTMLAAGPGRPGPGCRGRRPRGLAIVVHVAAATQWPWGRGMRSAAAAASPARCPPRRGLPVEPGIGWDRIVFVEAAPGLA